MGYALGEWRQKPKFRSEHIYPEDRELVAESRRKQIESTGSYDIEYRIVAADGRAL